MIPQEFRRVHRARTFPPEIEVSGELSRPSRPVYASPQRDICRVRGSPIDPAAELSSPQRILGRFSALDRLGISVAVLRVRTVRGRIADATAVSSIGDRSFLVAAADRQERALRVGSAPRDDIDDARHWRPTGSPGTADDLDAIDVVDQEILGIPEDAREQRRVDRSAIDHHLHLVGAVDCQPAAVDDPGAAVEAAHVYSVGETQGFREISDAGAMQVIASQYLNGCSRGADRVGASRRRRDIDFEQLLDRQLLQSILIRARSLLREAGRGPHHAGQTQDGDSQAIAF